ncbi:Mitochondrial copper homeostasis protein [Coniochaeta pulveracea]|uniref:Mitochondrial copper homeostasis protein n=1 Tax=Coniochaeta pulveracea TaxID=177199 RepID=A0A420YBI6_9PEZI|nr:Mitochondrial copper homeostasis protein [Coniochaeta pulveracea]
MAAEGGSSSKDPWSKEVKSKFESKPKSAFLDPCQEAANRSIRCLNRNDGDRTLCTDYFEAYRACKKEWTEKRKKERGSWFS